MDYAKLGLKAGIEVHNQLNTRHKLFCDCSTAMKGEVPVIVTVRKQHPVASELGEYDTAAQYEVMRDRTFLYEGFKGETCHVELDEEPPHRLNQEALETAITVSMLLNCRIPDEVHVMRKTVIDGSNTTSFQRTMVIGMNGFIEYKGRKVPIDQVSLEEDACAIAGEENGSVKYRLNRLGVPLVEVATGLLVDLTPAEIQEISFQIGMTVRSTGKAKKTIGAIRQDVNVSVRGGARNELKGIQELSLLSKSIENEANRQLFLIWLRDELRRLGVEKIHDDPVSVTSVLSGTTNRILRSTIEGNGNIYAVVLPKFAGLFKKSMFEGKTLGREMADVAVAFGLKGLFHSDEDLSKYQLEEDFEKVRSHLKVKPTDLLILIGDDKTKGRVAREVVERARTFLKGVQEGTRSANPDGSSKFNRPLPGAKRMYPESDIVPIPITPEMLKNIRRNLPEPIGKRAAKMENSYKISRELADQLLRLDRSEVFEGVVKKTGVEPRLVASALASTSKEIEREGLDSSILEERHFVDIFSLVASGKLVKESVPDVMRFLVKNRSKSASDAMASLGIKAISQSDIERIVKEAVSKAETVDKAIGMSMSQLRGKVDAKVVVETVKRMWGNK